jgi:DNA helicase II / ATP-dependent DNA helicase PcrA
MAGFDVSVEQVLADAEATGHAYIRAWLDIVESSADELLPLLRAALDGGPSVKNFKDQAQIIFESRAGSADRVSDLLEDLGAWRELNAEISRQIGRNAPLEQFLQELQLRSKEPSPRADTVTLTTIHGAKGKEFDFVFIVGLAEDVMPSFQSKERGEVNPQMEEERRNCFVAITRARECLVLSRAEMYRGWRKAPSRFLVEMGLAA